MTTAATHLIADDIGDPDWLTGDEGADAEILAGLDKRLEAEVLMDVAAARESS